MTNDCLLMENFLKRIEEERLGVNFIQIHREGELTAEFARMRKCRLPSWSLAKGFTSCGVGLALEEGLLSLDERVVDIFPEEVGRDTDENLKKVTLWHLLTMTSGLEKPLFFGDERECKETKDWIHHFFQAKFTHEPGTSWLYSNFNTYMAACAVEKRAGMNLFDYMKPRFFDRIGWLSPTWTSCPMGHTAAANGLMLDIDELSLYGDVILHYGKGIVPETYMKEATRVQVDNSVLRQEDNKNFAGYGYGYQFLKNPGDGFRSEGRYGQQCIALPSRDVVVSVMSFDERARRIGTILFEEVIEAILA